MYALMGEVRKEDECIWSGPQAYLCCIELPIRGVSAVGVAVRKLSMRLESARQGSSDVAAACDSGCHHKGEGEGDLTVEPHLRLKHDRYIYTFLRLCFPLAAVSTSRISSEDLGVFIILSACCPLAVASLFRLLILVQTIRKLVSLGSNAECKIIHLFVPHGREYATTFILDCRCTLCLTQSTPCIGSAITKSKWRMICLGSAMEDSLCRVSTLLPQKLISAAPCWRCACRDTEICPCRK